MNDHAMLTTYLGQRDEPCPRCGYNLRALTGQTCPECGAALRLRVGLVEPRIAAYVWAVGICFMGFGGALLFSLLAYAYGGLEWFIYRAGYAGILLPALLVTCGIALALALPGRRLFLCRNPRTQYWIAVACTLYVAGMFVSILVLFNDA